MGFLLALMLSFAGLTIAAPTLEHRQTSNTTTTAGTTTQLTFQGAGASFTVNAPLDGSTFQIPNPISVDAITQVGAGNCAFTGINGVKLTVVGTNNGATIAPPQTIESGSCSA
ncbi:hypothetical protein M406DRAFT_353263 [Cryphonectria parasitica EP155]|uniref:Uncharacterized protein n=1 Tax=Cryphonectria parasitica (strain ATCC 38755 / EP155) TaxID=660469 RepID=A0A9P5CK10_CRYP1|nr:uncharacterized protein M406DRAFT_353263 [Cryphonectria parasitica EP155]KAF3761794.1 hypothetical protein M406DRAFT_353263 [Cryphonectria parasitica EP155]